MGHVLLVLYVMLALLSWAFLLARAAVRSRRLTLSAFAAATLVALAWPIVLGLGLRLGLRDLSRRIL